MRVSKSVSAYLLPSGMGNSLPINGTEAGRILDCEECSSVCHFRCCDQSREREEDFGLDNALLLYPGEWESAREETRRHILITMDDFHGGKLGCCDRGNFDQSQCDPTRNFKPLDCLSYPFTPSIGEAGLEFLIDPRCPLATRDLGAHFENIRRRWEQALASNPSVVDWISHLKIDGYVPYAPSVHSPNDGNS